MTISLRLTLNAEQTDTAEDLCWANGALAVTLLDACDQPLLEPAPGETPLWRRVTLEALLDSREAADALEGALGAAGLIDATDPALRAEIPERDWTRAWMDRYRPMRFGRALWICPTHLEPDPDWPLVVRLDPGLAFGTGTHPTTALCLEWLDGQAVEGRDVIDYGCGSGVLAVAAALKGARSVLAVDHDPQALDATAANAAANGVDRVVGISPPRPLDAGSADILIANILAGPLIELAGTLTAALRPGGVMALSGILAGQRDALRDAYADRLEVTGEAGREAWLRLDLHRPDADRKRPA